MIKVTRTRAPSSPRGDAVMLRKWRTQDTRGRCVIPGVAAAAIRPAQPGDGPRDCRPDANQTSCKWCTRIVHSSAPARPGTFPTRAVTSQ